ncbi:MAG TPA: hypothetical protein VKQ70_04630 [Caulobacteraceae bacterium]|nr:hypothetical protein [Caulobacteraceae bacterium]
MNKGLITPPNAADPGVWDGPVNQNSHTLDQVLGGLTVLNAQGLTGVQVLTLAQYTPANIVVTGVPGGPVTFQLPAGVGGFYFVANLCTGANSTVSFASASVAGSVGVPTADTAAIIIDPVYGARLADTIEQDAVGPVGAVQYAGANGNFAGDAGLTYTPATQALTVGGPLKVGGNITMGGVFLGLAVAGNAQTAPVAIPFAGTGMIVNCELSNVFTTTLSGAITGAPSFTNVGDGQTINWRLQQDGTGNRTMAWPSNFRWPGGTAGVLSTTANAVDLLVASFFASTGTWLASLLKGFA